jgi:Flp pilus assembly CpaE family ATPase
MSRVKVIVNASDEGTDVLESEIEAMLDHSVAAYLPSDAAHVVESINNGKPMVESLPGEPLSTVFEKLAERTYRRWDKGTGE